jgi:peroxiredoxin family protein
MAKMVIGLTSCSIDKLTSAGVMLSGAAADDMEIEVYVLVNAAHAFMKNKPFKEFVNEDSQTVEEFKSVCEKISTPGWLQFFEMAKEMTSLRVIICSLAGRIAGGDKKDDFIDIVDDFCGIGEYLDAAKEADLHINI